MIAYKLTSPAGPVHNARPKHERSGFGGMMQRLLLIAGLMALPGCISIESPDKPIVIELNINITQEVIYRLAADAQETIDENADIF